MAEERLDLVVRQRGAGTASREISRVGGASRTAGSAVRFLQGALLTVGVGFTLGSTVRTLANFSQEMSTVKAITNSTGAEFEALREEAKRLGSSTRFSASQAAEGATALARAGFETSEVMESLESTLQLAQAGALGLGDAADIASNVMQGFRVEADETQRVVDVLALAANTSNTNVQQLGDAMKLVAPVAAGLGVDFEEATAAVGALSNAGLQATRAGTGLRRVLSKLENPTGRATDVLESLGLTADEVSVEQVGLTEAVRRLGDAGIDTGQALKLFGDQGGPAFQVLRDSLPDVENMDKALNEAEGTAGEIAKTMDDNLNGALLSVGSAFEGLQIAIGDLGSESALTSFFNGLAETIRNTAQELPTIATALEATMIKTVGTLEEFRILAVGQAQGLFRQLKEAAAGTLSQIQLQAADFLDAIPGLGLTGEALGIQDALRDTAAGLTEFAIQERRLTDIVKTNAVERAEARRSETDAAVDELFRASRTSASPAPDSGSSDDAQPNNPTQDRTFPRAVTASQARDINTQGRNSFDRRAVQVVLPGGQQIDLEGTPEQVDSLTDNVEREAMRGAARG